MTRTQTMHPKPKHPRPKHPDRLARAEAMALADLERRRMVAEAKARKRELEEEKKKAAREARAMRRDGAAAAIAPEKAPGMPADAFPAAVPLVALTPHERHACRILWRLSWSDGGLKSLSSVAGISTTVVAGVLGHLVKRGLVEAVRPNGGPSSGRGRPRLYRITNTGWEELERLEEGGMLGLAGVGRGRDLGDTEDAAPVPPSPAPAPSHVADILAAALSLTPPPASPSCLSRIPTLDEIASRAAEIRSTWDARTELARRGMRVLALWDGHGTVDLLAPERNPMAAGYRPDGVAVRWNGKSMSRRTG